jgi:hypothetical protein
MKNLYLTVIRYALLSAILVLLANKGSAQTGMHEEFNKWTLREKMNYLEERTRIYESYRAVREDMFQNIKLNELDSLNLAKNKIISLNSQTILLNQTIVSLKATLATNKTSMDEVTRERNSIQILGMNVNKSTYNTIVWAIIAILLVILALGYVIFKRNLIIITNTKKDLKDLNLEFEAYRKTSREAREKMTMDHFLEMKRLKGV